ncbi:MAG: cytidine deaminase [Lachnospiraceae bacterium]
MTHEENIREVVRLALEARKHAYAPYSNYRVGAGLMTEDGTFYSGCNIENASYGATNCAERTAIFKAVSEGHSSIRLLAVAGGNGEEPTGYAFPCGVCRQVMREFAEPKNLEVIVAKSCKEYKVFHLDALLPESFGPDFQTEN